MFRSAPLLLLAIPLFLDSAAPAQAPPAEDSRKLNALAVQQAMAGARQHLREQQPQKAVEMLEDQLNRAGGNPGYLELLRDAYCAFIRALFLENDAPRAQRYLQRLSILDPAEAQKLTTPAHATPVKFAPLDKKRAMPLPDFAARQAKETPRPPQVIATTGDVKPTARGKIDDAAADPFHPSHERAPASIDSTQLAGKLLARANEEFTRKRYKEARTYYEQACQADKGCAELCRDSFAYCMLNEVVEHLNRPGLGGKSIDELQKDIHGALSMAPRLAPTGQWLLREIDQRSQGQTSGSLREDSLPMQHFGRNAQGWQVTETAHFRIFHNQQRDLVEQVAHVAERTRAEMQRKWFGNDTCDWQPKCELVIHANAAEYSRLTGVPTTSPGHSRIESEPTTQRVIGRRLDLHVDNPGMLEAVLPHEATHVVLAGQFGPYQVPRWADEGIAVLTEPAEKIEQHRRNLHKAAHERELFSVKELMELENYPQPRRIGAFYAQSVNLVEFLVQQRGPVAFTEFVKDGLRQGYEAALRKHYNWDFATLQQQWEKQVLAGQ